MAQRQSDPVTKIIHPDIKKGSLMNQTAGDTNIITGKFVFFDLRRGPDLNR